MANDLPQVIGDMQVALMRAAKLVEAQIAERPSRARIEAAVRLADMRRMLNEVTLGLSSEPGND